MKKLLFPLLAVLFLAQCKQDDPNPLSADFQINVVHPTHTDRAPLKVRVVAKESGASYSWQTTGIAPNVSGEAIEIVFQTGAVHTIRLTTTKNGVSSTSEQKITVKPAFTRVVITKITLNSFPATKPSGVAWDNLSGDHARADVYCDITSGTTLIAQNGIIVNAFPTIPCAWNNQITIGSAYFNSPVSITYYDNDAPSSPAYEFIGGISFVPQNYVTDTEVNRYPSVISGGTTIPTVLNLSWQQ